MAAPRCVALRRFGDCYTRSAKSAGTCRDLCEEDQTHHRPLGRNREQRRPRLEDERLATLSGTRPDERTSGRALRRRRRQLALRPVGPARRRLRVGPQAKRPGPLPLHLRELRGRRPDLRVRLQPRCLHHSRPHGADRPGRPRLRDVRSPAPARRGRRLSALSIRLRDGAHHEARAPPPARARRDLRLLEAP